MIEDEEIPLIDVTVTIGGDLPEQELKKFIHTAAYMLYSESYQGNQYKKYIKHTEEMIAIKIRTLDCASLDLQIKAQNGDINGAFTMYCVLNKLSMTVRNAPHIDSNGNYKNEAITLYLPGQSNLTVIPTDGETNPTTLVEDVFYALDDIFTAIETPEIEAPLHINDHGTLGDVSRRRLAGEDLRKILTETLKSRIAYPDFKIPPFKIIKGK